MPRTTFASPATDRARASVTEYTAATAALLGSGFSRIGAGEQSLYTSAATVDRGSGSGVDFSLLDRTRRTARALWSYSNILSAMDRFLDADVIGPMPTAILPAEVPHEISKEILRRWRRWCQPATTGGIDFATLCSLVLRNSERDGDAPIRITTGADGLPMLQLLEADAINSTFTGSIRIPPAVFASTQAIRHGVVMDMYNRALGYMVSEESQEAQFGAYWSRQQTYRDEPPSFESVDSMLLYFRPRSSMILRGLPAAAGEMRKLIAIEDNDFARLFASNKEASLFAFLESNVQSSGGFGHGVSGLNPLATGPSAPVSEPTASMTPIAGTEEYSTGLNAITLAPGVTARTMSSATRDGNANAFIKTLITRVCASLGLPYQTLTRDFADPGFATSRQVQVAERVYAYNAMHKLTNTILRPVIQRWAPVALADMMLDDDTYTMVVNDIRLEPRPAPSLDARAEATAMQISLGQGVTTRAIELNRRGVTLRDYYAALKEERDIAAEFGVPVTPSGPPAGAPMPGAPMPGGDDPDDPEPASTDDDDDDPFD